MIDAGSGVIWNDVGSAGQCYTEEKEEPPSGVPYIRFDVDTGSYSVNDAADSKAEMKVCPAVGTYVGTCPCATACQTTSSDNTISPCLHTCKPCCGRSSFDLVVTFCPLRTNTSTSTAMSTSRATSTSSTKTSQSTSASIVSTKISTSSTTKRPHSTAGKEKECPCTVEQLWSDVVIAIDNVSDRMKSNLKRVNDILSTVLRPVSIRSSVGWNSRVGLMTYNTNTSVVASLGKITSYGDFVSRLKSIKISNDDHQPDLVKMLNTSDFLLGESNGRFRRPIVLILVVGNYPIGARPADPFNPQPFADHLKSKGHKVITLYVLPDWEWNSLERDKVAALASRGFNFTTEPENVLIVQEMQRALCQANCFCPNGWTQYVDDLVKPTASYNECVELFVGYFFTWNKASQACGNMTADKAYLASELTKSKHNFHVQYIKSLYTRDSFMDGRNIVYIFGLSFDMDADQYLWEQKDEQGVRLALNPAGFQDWITGHEDHLSKGLGVQVTENLSGFYWQNVNKDYGDISGDVTEMTYLCQRTTCDTDNYCADTLEASTLASTTVANQTDPTTVDPQVHLERPCSCNLSNAWLDVILIIDVSAGMSHHLGLKGLISFLLYVMKDVTVGQGLVHETRIGIVTYATTSSVYAPLEKYGDYEQLLNDAISINGTVDDEVNIAQGLTEAYEMYYTANPEWDRPAVFILAASAYTIDQEDPAPVADDIKGHVLLITVYWVQDFLYDELQAKLISAIASEGSALILRSDESYEPAISQTQYLMCQANCLCPFNWAQLYDSSYNPPVYYGECIQYTDYLDWSDSQQACAEIDTPKFAPIAVKVWLATELSHMKHMFNMEYLRDSDRQAVPYRIGLLYNHSTGTYFWEETRGSSRIPLDKDAFQPWMYGAEKHEQGYAVVVTTAGKQAYWTNEDPLMNTSIGLCQTNACDTDNYCSPDFIVEGIRLRRKLSHGTLRTSHKNL